MSLPSGEFHSTYRADMTVFPSRMSRNFCILAIALAVLAPLSIGDFQFVDDYMISLLIQIGIFGIAALGLNILVGFT
jgi:branched-chain amino acid transport system permease protein